MKIGKLVEHEGPCSILACPGSVFDNERGMWITEVDNPCKSCPPRMSGCHSYGRVFKVTRHEVNPDLFRGTLRKYLAALNPVEVK